LNEANQFIGEIRTSLFTYLFLRLPPTQCRGTTRNAKYDPSFGFGKDEAFYTMSEANKEDVEVYAMVQTVGR